MTLKEIDLKKYRGNHSTIFTGRPQGEDARKELKLDGLDNNEDIEICLQIPSGTTSFNPSFYLGLLYPSFKKLGIEGFNKKYKFRIEEKDEEIRKVISDNLEDGQRNALNELNKKTGLRSFID